MKPSQIYRKAAEIIDRDRMWWCCNQIMKITGEDCTKGPNVLKLAEYFRPLDYGGDWFGRDWEHRVMALLLMSEIAKDSEK